MAYETYTTEALVCGTRDHNTADRSYLLLTKTAGMLFADARSVREERSRQRYALQDFSLIRVSLVKGKQGWRIGSVSADQNLYHAAVDKVARGSVVGLVRMLRRFLHGDGATDGLFAYVIAAAKVLSGPVAHRSFVELAIQVELLAKLGYVDRNKMPENVRETAPEEVAAQYTPVAERVLSRLHAQAVTTSHL